MRLLILSLVLALSGCVSVQTPTAPPKSDVASIEVIEDLPSEMPKGATQFNQSQLVFVHADQASEFLTGLVVPIPFVTGIVVDYVNDSAAEGYETKLKQMRVYDIVNNELAKQDALQLNSEVYKLYPFVFIEECSDDVYRLSLTYQLEKDGWIGRYYYHLPTTIQRENIDSPTLETLSSINRDLRFGVPVLLQIVESDIKGELPRSGRKAEVGSLYIVGGNISGIISPTVSTFKNAEIIYETTSTLTISIPGDPTGKAKNGGMAFGIHYFEKDQLHTLIR